MVRISFPDSAPRDASVFAQRLLQDLRREGTTKFDVVIVKESSESQDAGSVLLIGAALHQHGALPGASLQLAARAKDPALMALELADHLHTGIWLKGIIAPAIFGLSHRFRTRIRIDTQRGSIDVDAQNTTLEDTQVKIEKLTDDGSAGAN